MPWPCVLRPSISLRCSANCVVYLCWAKQSMLSAAECSAISLQNCAMPATNLQIYESQSGTFPKLQRFKASKPNFPALASGWAGSAMCILSHAIRFQLADSISRHVCPYLPFQKRGATKFDFSLHHLGLRKITDVHGCSRMFKHQSH